MKTLVFLRHGESDWDAQGRYQGQTDVPLSETGRAQAYEAARRWGHTEFDSVIVSPLTRTKDTGRIMLLDRQLEPILVNDIIETDGGAWEGLLLVELQNVGQTNTQRFDHQIWIRDRSVVRRHENLEPVQHTQCLMLLKRQMSCLSFHMGILFALQLISLLVTTMMNLPPYRVYQIAVPTYYSQTPGNWAHSL